MTRHHTIRLLLMVVLCAAPFACRERRVLDEDSGPTFADVKPVLDAECVKCHSGPQPAAGYTLNTYYGAIGCTKDGRVMTAPAGSTAPLIAALRSATHRTLLDQEQEQLLARWVRAGAPARPGQVHAAGISDPRSQGWHGTLAANDDWAPLHSPAAPLVCGACHAGAPVRPDGVRFAAPGAPDCTSCHDTSNGVLDCATCHGQGQRAYPPRDPCYFEQTAPGAHAAHLDALQFRNAPLPCTTCHELPPRDLFSGAHANGKIDVHFDSRLAGSDATYDQKSMQCSVGCHARGGTRATPAWQGQSTDSGEPAVLDCNSCHQSPPPAHYAGTCDSCHSEMGEQANTLTPGPLHINGKVDIGSGNASCGSCHGTGENAWPADAVHQLHRTSLVMRAVPCTSCHAVPASLDAEGHLDGKVLVSFSDQVPADGLAPRFDLATRSCQDVACHGAGLSSAAVSPRWAEPPSDPAPCNSCHSVPPPAPHVQLSSCGGGLCHGAEVAQSSDGYRITASGRERHIDGVVQTGN